MSLPKNDQRWLPPIRVDPSIRRMSSWGFFFLSARAISPPASPPPTMATSQLMVDGIASA
jgi:hypothetical protein